MDRTAVLWSLERKSPLRIVTGGFAKIGSAVTTVRWHPNCQMFACSTSSPQDRLIRLYDPLAPQQPARVFCPSHISLSLAFSRDGRFMASGGNDGSILLYDIRQGKLSQLATNWKTNSPVMSLDFSYATAPEIPVSGESHHSESHVPPET